MKSLLRDARKYGTVALLGWQDALVYRLNMVVWILYAVMPSATLMLIWLATYGSNPGAKIGGLSLAQMMTYYLCVTALSVAITPNPEWEIAQTIRDGKITAFLVRPISYYGYRVAQETSYQIIKSAMLIPAFLILLFLFRDYVAFPPFDFARAFLFVLSSLLAYALLTQIKFLIGISAFWIAEPQGFMEIFHLLLGVFGGRLVPLSLLPSWLRTVGDWLPFASLYGFPMQLLLNQPHAPTAAELFLGFARQLLWLAALSVLVKFSWNRGTRAYEAYGG